MSYTRLLYHIIFRTKHGVPSINEKHEKDLYRCIWKFTQEQHCILYRVNGMLIIFIYLWIFISH